MAEKKLTKPAAQAAVAKAAPAKKAPAPKPAPVKPAAKAIAKTAAKPIPTKGATKTPAAKATPKPTKLAPTKKTAVPPKPSGKAPAKAVAAAKKAEAPVKPAAAKSKAETKVATPKVKAGAKPEAKESAASKTKVALKPETPKAEKKAGKAELKPAKVEAKPAPTKPVKAEKPAKPPKPEKPPKLAPVEAAFAKPKPAKPLAVAAGRAQPLTRTLATPIIRTAPKPLTAPKPMAAEPEVVGELQPVPAFKTKASSAKGMILVGAVAGAFGVKGEVRLRAFTEKKDGVISYGPLYGEDGKMLLKPKNWRELKDGVAVVAPEVKSREDAEKLKGARLFVPRANLPAPPEDEFYIVDLLGCRAEALDGKVLGEICAVWNFGAGDIIEYRPPNGGPNVRVTFTKDTAPLVDLPGKRVVLDPPAPEPLEK